MMKAYRGSVAAAIQPPWVGDSFREAPVLRRTVVTGVAPFDHMQLGGTT